MADPRVLSIPPGAAFIPTLVSNLLDGHIIPGFAPRADPLALASATIWVPTRRAVRTLTATFAEKMDGRAALLPRIRALGDADEGEAFSATVMPVDARATIGSMERLLVLARLVSAWASRLNEQQRGLFGGADIIVPATIADAISMAGQLADLMDNVATEEADWSKLGGLVPDDLQEWWQLTLQFLEIATTTWPEILAERGAVDAATLRVAALRRQAALYGADYRGGPVIAAGSTGSIPATEALLKAVSRLPQGAVVLPGLDRDLDPETWEKVDLPDNDRDDTGAAPGHPQFGLRKLLRALGVSRDAEMNLAIPDNDPGIPRLREDLVSEAQRPSASTHLWQDFFKRVTPDQRAAALADVALVEAPGEREEALAIAFALREKLEQPDACCALVTPDRNLARRVAVEMGRFGVSVDDSAGLPLKNRPAGVLARLVVAQAYGPAEPQATVALIHHPLARFGLGKGDMARGATTLELAGLRDALEPVAKDGFGVAIPGTLERKEGGKRLHSSVSRLTPSDWSAGEALADAMDTTFGPIAANGGATVPEMARETIGLIERVARNEAGALDALTGRPSGAALVAFLADLAEQDDTLAFERSEWPSIFDALIEGQPVRTASGTHPRVTILGPLEARMQTYDRVVLGGLNEGTWPAAGGNDPFLSRPMKAQLGLPTPERRTGLAAHDFAQLMGMDDVVLTRSKRSGGAPTVASRWVQRLNTVAGEKAAKAMRGRGQIFLDWALAADRQQDDVPPAPQPMPKPPLDKRPTRLSVTQVATWVRDPYAIYARHILELDPLPPLVREADHRERGTLIHRALEDFVALPQAQQTMEKLLSLGRDEFQGAAVPSSVLVRWWPRFEQAAAAFFQWHQGHMKDVDKVVAECWGATDDGLGDFELRGVADRFDEMTDGRLQLWDYKTTNGPSAAAVLSGQAPQLPLLAEMSRRGAFEKVSGTVASLGYIRMLSHGAFDDSVIADETGKPATAKTPAKPTADELAASTWAMLADLVADYRDPSQPYVSKARYLDDETYAGDFDHLARVGEWSTASTEGGDA